MSARVLLLPGDGIGPEIVAEAARLLACLRDDFGFEVDIDTGLIDQSCQRVIVGGKHRDFFTCSLHLLKRVGGHFPCFAVDGHDSSTALGVFNASPAVILLR